MEGATVTQIEHLKISFKGGGLSVEIESNTNDVVYGSVTDFAAKILDIKAFFGQEADTLMADLLDERRSSPYPVFGAGAPGSPAGLEQKEPTADDDEEEPVERVGSDEDHGPLATKDKALRRFLDED